MSTRDSAAAPVHAPVQENARRANPALFSHDLPSSPRADIGTVLVTGASGYIGGRIVPELLARGYRVRIMIRGPAPELRAFWPDAEVVIADALDRESLGPALRGIDTAYYLLHSLMLGPSEFESADIRAAANFAAVAQEHGVKRIIYLGGLGDIRNRLSPHLKNRIEVSNELRKKSVPVTILRAAVIIGSGSASYEIIKHLAKNLPVFFIPPWARNKCQPIAIRDVVKYLVGALEHPETAGKIYDIGGKDILSYEEMVRIFADMLRKKKLFIPMPFLTHIGVYAYVASLLTPVPDAIIECLMDGLENEVVCQNNEIKEVIRFEPISYKEAIVRAMSREEQDKVYTRWSDAYPPAHELAMKLHELDPPPAYSVVYTHETSKSAAALFASVCKVGGTEGWFHGNWMWRLRGMIDKILLGVGTARGRKRNARLTINDVIDFWRVEGLVPDKKLLLRAEMKLPGKAWLEFTIEDRGGSRRLSVKPSYTTQTLFGKIYWYIFLPFHHSIFVNLLKQIDMRS